MFHRPRRVCGCPRKIRVPSGSTELIRCPDLCKAESSRVPLRGTQGYSDFAWTQILPSHSHLIRVALLQIATQTWTTRQYILLFLHGRHHSMLPWFLRWGCCNPSDGFDT